MQQLVDGSLPPSAFEFYLAQDALYLKQYARALTSLAATSTEHSAQVFWAQSALNVPIVEASLHRSRLETDLETGVSPVTEAYTNFLLAHTLGSPRVVGAAAVLPCYWLYAQTGASLPHIGQDHPYADWLGTYADAGFVESTQQALQQVEAEFDAATPQTRSQAARAYLTACRHELEFFSQALRHDTAVTPQEATFVGV